MAAFVNNALRWRVLFQLLSGDREGIPLTELEALVSPVGGQLAGALTAQLRVLAPVQPGMLAAEVTFEGFLTAVSSAVMVCASSGCAGAELLSSNPSASVTAEDMRTALVQWDMLAEGNSEEVSHQRNEAVRRLKSRLSKTVAEQARTIARLEAEKRWLIQELFQCQAQQEQGQHTSTHNTEHDTSSVDSLLL